MKRVMLLGLFIVMTVVGTAQISQARAMFIFNFAKNIGWPEADAGTDLTMTVIGDNDLVNELQKLAATRKVGSRSVVVVSAANAVVAKQSQVYYVGENKIKEIPALLEKYPKGGVIISGRQGQCPAGAGFCFFVNSEGKLNYEISLKSINRAGLSVSTKMVELGKVVD